MSKYIIDTDQFEKLFETKAVAVLGIGDNPAVPEEGEKTVWTRMLNVADLEELTSDYINEHFGDLQDTAYQRGLEDGKAVNNGCEGCKYAEMGSDITICAECCNGYSNQWTAKDDEIKVGDEVEVLNSGNKYLIAWFAGTSLCGFAHDGVTCRLQPSDVRKTGRHFDIDKILEGLRYDS